MSASLKKANVRDVARHAGVSVATVSRVLNGASNVSAATRVKVERTMEVLNFVPSSAARAINSGRTRLVGALIPTLDHAIFARFIDALEGGLDQHGLSLVVSTTNHDVDRELNRAQKLLDIGAEGLVVSGVTRADGFDKLIARYQVPVIATSYFDEAYLYPTVGYDNVRVARQALDHLVSIGHSQIAVLMGPSKNNDRTRARLDGVKDQSAAQLNIVETELTFAAAASATSQILRATPKATAMLCLSDVLAQGALLRLKAEGIAVPTDMSVIGIDDLPSSSSYDPPLTTVHLPVGGMGKATATAIANWISSGLVPDSIDLDTRLMQRATTSARRPGAA